MGNSVKKGEITHLVLNGQQVARAVFEPRQVGSEFLL